MNILKKTKSSKELVNIGTYNIYVVLNTFMEGLQEFGDEFSNFVVIFRHFFLDWLARCKDFRECQKKKGTPYNSIIQLVSTRRLTLGPAIY